MEPCIQYAKTADGVSIAFWTLGEGMPLVHMPVFPFSQIQLEWQNPEYRSWYERLAKERKLVRYDARGTGLSDRDVTDYSLDAVGSQNPIRVWSGDTLRCLGSLEAPCPHGGATLRGRVGGFLICGETDGILPPHTRAGPALGAARILSFLSHSARERGMRGLRGPVYSLHVRLL